MSNVLDPQKIQDAESDGSTSLRDQLKDHPEQVDQELAGIADATKNAENDGFFKDSGNSSKKSRSIFKRSRVAVGGAGLLIGGGLGIFSILQGPLEFVHIFQLMQRFHIERVQDLTDDGSSKFFKYLSNRNLERQDRRIGRKMAYINGKFNSRMAAQGVEFKYDSAGKFTGIEVDKNSRTYKELQAAGFEANDSADGKALFADGQGDKLTRNGKTRGLINATYDSTNFSKTAAAVGSRIEQRRAGASFRILGNTSRRINETELQFRQRIRDAYEEKVRRGEPRSPRIAGQQNETNENDTQADKDAKAQADDLAGEGAGELQDSVDQGKENAKTSGLSEQAEIKKSITNKVNNGSKYLLALTVVCVAKSIGDNFDKQMYRDVLLPGIRLAAASASIGSQIMSPLEPGLDLGELGEHKEQLYDIIEETSWVQADGVRHELGQDLQNHPLPPYADPLQVNNEILAFVSSVPGLGTACSIAGNTLVNIAIDAVSAATVIGFAAGQGVGVLLDNFLFPKVIDYVANHFAVQGIGSEVSGAAFGNIVNLFTRVLANDQATGMGAVDQGPDEGAVLREKRFEEERIRLANTSVADKLLDISEPTSVAASAYYAVPKSGHQLVAKIGSFNLGSLFGGLFSPFTSKVSAAEGDDFEYSVNIWGFEEELLQKYEDPYAVSEQFFANLKQVKAAEERCEASVDAVNLEAGSIVQTYHEQCELLYKNGTPSTIKEFNTGDSDYTTECTELTNAQCDDIAEDNVGEPPTTDDAKTLDHNQSNGRACFGTEMNDNGTLVFHDTPNFKKIPETCKDGGFGNDAWLMYRMLLYYANIESSMACYFGDDESCSELGFGAAQAPSGGGSNTSFPPGAEGGYKGVDTSGAACPPGSQEIGVKKVPTGENLPASVVQTSIKLCDVPEIGGNDPGINVAITQNFMDMIAKARLDGIELAGSSFRTTLNQISLRRSHCGTSTYDIYQKPSRQCTPPTAIPGSSMHEHGLAVDFTHEGKIISSRGSAAFKWLDANAANYGFKNLPREPWHWSTTGN